MKDIKKFFRSASSTLFHQCDPLLEFAAIRCRPPQEKHSTTHRRKVVLSRQREQLSRNITADLRLATDLKDDRR